MQDEIELQDTELSIRIMGVNGVGLESANALMVEGRDLPWCQPEADQDVWTLWEVEYRDVVILGPGNERLGAFNLTVHDLADPFNYQTLRDQLLSAAGE